MLWRKTRSSCYAHAPRNPSFRRSWNMRLWRTQVLEQKKERIEMLEEYRESLKCELDGVEEELKEIS